MKGPITRGAWIQYVLAQVGLQIEHYPRWRFHRPHGTPLTAYAKGWNPKSGQWIEVAIVNGRSYTIPGNHHTSSPLGLDALKRLHALVQEEALAS